MVETTSVREEKPKLSAKDRLCLIQTINALPPTQFDELAFALNPPKGVVASNTAAQGTRSKDLLDWLEGSSGPGLAAADEVLQILIPKTTKTAPQPVAFAISGKMGDLHPSEIEAIAELLRQKTGDASISLAFSMAGSIKLILNGSPEGLSKLQEIFEAGELKQLDIPPVEAVTPVDGNSLSARKARLIQALRLCDGSLAARALVSNITLALDLTRDRARDRNRAQSLALDIYTSFNRALRRALDRDRDRDIARALEIARDRALEIADGRARDIDLSEADLSGANLSNINLTNADLTNADLTYADVTGTIFRDNPGLTEADKRNLQRRGAIFLDPPSSDVPALVLR